MSGGILNLIAAFTTNGAYSQTGGTLNAASFNTSGSFAMSGGALNVGSFTQTGAGTLNLTGGTLNVTGNLTTSSSLLMNGGTIQNATIVNPANLSYGNSSGNVFDNVTLAAGQGLTVNDFTAAYGNSAYLRIADAFNFTSGVTFNVGTNAVGNGYGYLLFDSTSGNLNPTFNNATVNLGGAGGSYLGFGTGFNGTGNTLTFGSGLTIQGTGSIGYTPTFGSSGANLTNNGTISANIANNNLNVGTGYNPGPGSYNGTLTNNGTIQATTSGTTLSMSGGTIVNNNGGAILATGKSTVTENGTSFTNKGTLQVDFGSTGTLATTTSTQTAGTTIVNGTLKIVTPNNSVNTLNLQGGAMYGTGTINGNINNTGAVFGAGTPGASPTTGTLTETGNYTQSGTGVFSAAIGGTTPGSQFDFFTVSGSAVLGGYLDISLINGFVPTVGQSFLIISDSSQTGTFTNAPGNMIMDNSGRYLFQVIYGSNYVKLNGAGEMPEPNSGALLLIAALPCAAGIRKRIRRAASSGDAI